MAINVIEKNVGVKIPYEVVGKKIYFNDEIMINCSTKQSDDSVNVDICLDRDYMLGIGTDAGAWYIAQVVIPGIQYIYPETATGDEIVDPPQRIPLDMDDVTLILWALPAGYEPESQESEEA